MVDELRKYFDEAKTKDKIRTTIYIQEDLLQFAKKVCEKNNMNLSRFIEALIKIHRDYALDKKKEEKT